MIWCWLDKTCMVSGRFLIDIKLKQPYQSEHLPFSRSDNSLVIVTENVNLLLEQFKHHLELFRRTISSNEGKIHHYGTLRTRHILAD
jgi:hypothetical protein